MLLGFLAPFVMPATKNSVLSIPFSLPLKLRLKVLSSEMGPGEIRLIRQIFTKDSVAEVFLEKSARPPIL